jgi:flotillin
VQKAVYDGEVNRRQAESELAGTLQQNIEYQKIKAEEVGIEVVEKQKQIEVQRQEVQRREQELEATVRKPASAEQYRIETLANAERSRTETEAAGQASAIRATGEAEADATRARGLAAAEVQKAQGMAEADVIQAQGLAEAQAMQKKAAAWQEYNQAAIIQQLIDSLPRVAAAIAEPLTRTERIVVISSGGDGAGASRVTQDVANIIAQVPTTIEALTGVDVIGTIKNLPAVRGASEGQERAGREPAADDEASES